MGFDEAPKFAGLILAGGEGSRFGGPKAWARLPDGRSFLEACGATLREAGASPIAATLPPASDDPGIDGVEALPLPETGLDMFASLLTGVRHLVSDRDWTRLAVIPVDHPLVQPRSVAVLAAVRSDAAVPTFDGKRGHPICLSRSVVTKLLLGELGAGNLREALQALDSVEVPVDDPGIIANCNTPEALSEALRVRGARR